MAANLLADRQVRLSELGLVICDIRLPGIDGEEVFRQAAEAPGAPPFLFITGYADIDQAVRLMRAGAGDFVTKPFAMDDFLTRIAATFRHRSNAAGAPQLGVSRQMRQIEDTLRRARRPVAPASRHWRDRRRQGGRCALPARGLRQGTRPFIAVNCAAIPADLLESEIFGHERGAFTGAATRHVGYAERAKAGTLFLDEIGDMPLSLQAKLLRLLEGGIFRTAGRRKCRPVPGSGRRGIQSRSSDAVARRRVPGRSLFPSQRACGRIPPLRERPEDIPWLIEALFPAERSFGARHSRHRHARRGSGAGAIPGRATCVSCATGCIAPWRSHPASGSCRAISFRTRHPHPMAEGFFPTLAEVRDAAERRQIERALGTTDGQIAESAKLLGISRTTLWEKMRRLGIAGRSAERSESRTLGAAACSGFRTPRRPRRPISQQNQSRVSSGTLHAPPSAR